MEGNAPPWHRQSASNYGFIKPAPSLDVTPKCCSTFAVCERILAKWRSPVVLRHSPFTRPVGLANRPSTLVWFELHKNLTSASLSTRRTAAFRRAGLEPAFPTRWCAARDFHPETDRFKLSRYCSSHQRHKW